VRERLARHPRFHMHFTPTGSSWINQVERWFGFLTSQLIRRGARKSVQALEADIRAWIRIWNAGPRPFVWKKTAEEILGSPARYCRRISDAGHGCRPAQPVLYRAGPGPVSGDREQPVGRAQPGGSALQQERLAACE
jgi:hypothetical protein